MSCNNGHISIRTTAVDGARAVEDSNVFRCVSQFKTLWLYDKNSYMRTTWFTFIVVKSGSSVCECFLPVRSLSFLFDFMRAICVLFLLLPLLPPLSPSGHLILAVAFSRSAFIGIPLFFPRPPALFRFCHFQRARHFFPCYLFDHFSSSYAHCIMCVSVRYLFCLFRWAACVVVPASQAEKNACNGTRFISHKAPSSMCVRRKINDIVQKNFKQWRKISNGLFHHLFR